MKHSLLSLCLMIYAALCCNIMTASAQTVPGGTSSGAPSAAQRRAAPASLPTRCADIAAMKQCWRESPLSGLYILESSPLVSYTRMAGSDLHVYIQDDSGGVILVLPNQPMSFINPGDRLTNVGGSLALQSGSLTLLAATPPQVVSTGNAVEPQTVSLLALTQSPADYESMLIEADNVSATGGGNLFEPNRSYLLQQGAQQSAIATLFPRANYLGTLVPTAPFNLTALVDYNHATGEASLTPRSTADITYATGNLTAGSWDADDVYAADGYLNVRSIARQPLQVYSLLGQVVLNRWVDPGLTEIQMPAGGVYIVRLGGLTKRIGIP
jgi:hypothetical protein